MVQFIVTSYDTHHTLFPCLDGQPFAIVYSLNLNMSGTLHILEAVRDLKLSSRIIIAGSSTVYGASTEEWDGPVPEEAALKPVSPYGVSKAATEMRLGFDLS